MRGNSLLQQLVMFGFSEKWFFIDSTVNFHWQNPKSAVQQNQFSN